MQKRNVVNWFAEKMEIELQKNDHKGGWRHCYIRDLLLRIPEEYTELVEAVASKNIELIIEEAADVANFALMVADLAYRYGVQTRAVELRNGAESPIQAAAWTCPKCHSMNKLEWHICQGCDNPRPS